MPIYHIPAPISCRANFALPPAAHQEPTGYDPTPGLRRGRGRLRWRTDTGSFVCARGVGLNYLLTMKTANIIGHYAY